MSQYEASTFEDVCFAGFFESRRNGQTTQTSRDDVAEVAARAVLDGRISSTTDRNGYVQLNVRVPAEMKKLVLEERKRRKANDEDNSDVGDVVVDALRTYFAER